MGDRPKNRPSIVSIIVFMASATCNTLAYAEHLPLHTLPGKDVSGIHDVFSNFHTASLS